MKNLRELFEAAQTRSRVAELVQQGNWGAIMDLVKNLDTSSQEFYELRSLLSKLATQSDKAGQAARYILPEIEKKASEEDQEYFAGEFQKNINDVNGILTKYSIPPHLIDAINDKLESLSGQAMLNKQQQGGVLMKELMPLLRQVGDHLLAKVDNDFTEKDAKNEMIDILTPFVSIFGRPVPPEIVFMWSAK